MEIWGNGRDIRQNVYAKKSHLPPAG